LRFAVLSLAGSEGSHERHHHRPQRARQRKMTAEPSAVPLHVVTQVTNDLAKERHPDIEHDPWTRALWESTHQSFALRRSASENKCPFSSRFGSHLRGCSALDALSRAAVASGPERPNTLPPAARSTLNET
jgi:hypothetical protein